MSVDRKYDTRKIHRILDRNLNFDKNTYKSQ